MLCSAVMVSQNLEPIWFPHCPTCTWITSLMLACVVPRCLAGLFLPGLCLKILGPRHLYKGETRWNSIALKNKNKRDPALTCHCWWALSPLTHPTWVETSCWRGTTRYCPWTIERLKRLPLVCWTLSVPKNHLGAAHCQVFDALYPGKIPLSRVNFHASQSYEYVGNYKILQTAFKKIGIDKVTPSPYLSK